MGQDDEEEAAEEEGTAAAAAAAVAAAVPMDEDVQGAYVSKPSRDVRKRVDATRILTTEDFQLIGTTHLPQLAPPSASLIQNYHFNISYQTMS